MSVSDLAFTSCLPRADGPHTYSPSLSSYLSAEMGETGYADRNNMLDEERQVDPDLSGSVHTFILLPDV